MHEDDGDEVCHRDADVQEKRSTTRWAELYALSIACGVAAVVALLVQTMMQAEVGLASATAHYYLSSHILHNDTFVLAYCRSCFCHELATRQQWANTHLLGFGI